MMAAKKNGFEKRVLAGLAKISDKLIAHDERFARLETNVIGNLKDLMLTHYDKIYGKLEKMEQEFKLLNSAVSKIEERMEKAEKRAGGIEKMMATRGELPEVKKQTLDLLRRIERLEAKVGV